MEDDLNALENGRQPNFFRKWKTKKKFRSWKMEDDINISVCGRKPQQIIIKLSLG